MKTVSKSEKLRKGDQDGKWLGFKITDESLLDDIIALLYLKRKPNRKILPESMEKCGQLDLGYSHEEITRHLE